MAGITYRVTQKPSNGDELIPSLKVDCKIHVELKMAGEAPVLKLSLLQKDGKALIPSWASELILFRSESGESASNSYWRAGHQYHFMLEYDSQSQFDLTVIHVGPTLVFDLPVKLSANSPLAEQGRERRAPLRLGDVLRGLEIDGSPGAWDGGVTEPGIPADPNDPIYHTGTWHANQN